LEETKRECPTCGAEKEIIEIKLDISDLGSGEAIKLSCGHSLISDECWEQIKLTDSIKEEHKDQLGNDLLKSKQTKQDAIRGIRKQHVHTFDHKNRIRFHSVYEEDENGNWKLIFGPEARPFSKKMKKT
jgi:hypothetical protein